MLDAHKRSTKAVNVAQVLDVSLHFGLATSYQEVVLLLRYVRWLLFHSVLACDSV